MFVIERCNEVFKYFFLLLQNTLIGGIAGVSAMSWVSLNAQFAIASGSIHFEHKQMSTSNCSYDFEVDAPSHLSLLQEP